MNDEYLKNEEANIRKIARKRIEEIKELHPPTNKFRIFRIYGEEVYRILDLGSNWGFYLDEYRKKGWDAWGIELDDYPEDKKVFKEDIRLFDFSKLKRINIITAFCILEHISLNSLLVLLLELVSILELGGLLVIKAPWNKGFTGIMRPEKYYLDPNHLFEFGDHFKLIEKFLKDNDMELVKTVIEGIHPERAFPFLGKFRTMKWLTEKLGMGDSRVWYFQKGVK